MVTWIPSIYPLYVSIYTSTMDPSWDLLQIPKAFSFHSIFPIGGYCAMMNRSSGWVSSPSASTWPHSEAPMVAKAKDASRKSPKGCGNVLRKQDPCGKGDLVRCFFAVSARDSTVAYLVSMSNWLSMIFSHEIPGLLQSEQICVCISNFRCFTSQHDTAWVFGQARIETFVDSTAPAALGPCKFWRHAMRSVDMAWENAVTVGQRPCI